MQRRAWSYLSFLVVVALAIPTVQGQTLPSVYVSQTDGNDVPSCGPIKKPCKTFAFCMTRVSARGRVIVLNTGEYGPVQITKSVTIEATPGVDAMVESVAGPNSAAIEIAGGVNDNVTLRGLKVMLLAPGGRGILFSSGAALYVENCVVDGGLENIDIFPFGFTGDVRVYIRDTVASSVTARAISYSEAGVRVLRHIANSVRVQIERSSMEGNDYGLIAADGASVTARDCVMARNRFMGVALGGVTGTLGVRPTELTLVNDVISGNGSGIGTLNGGVTARVSNCTITDNDQGIDLGGLNQILSRGNNTLEANTVDGTFTGIYTAK